MGEVAVTAILAAYNEADVIGPVVSDLVAQGIGVYLLDDGSTDGTADAARAAAGPHLLGVERTPGGDDTYRWGDILRRKQALARELPGDWFLHYDADEFRESPWIHLSLREGLALVDRLGWNAVDFAVLHFPPTHDRFAAGTDPRLAFPHWEPGGVHDKVQIKGWKRAPEVDLVTSGGHEARFRGRRVFPLRFLLRHYPIRSQAHGERKVFRERKPRFLASEREKTWHFQYDAFQPGHAFLRDPADLRTWDAEAVRVELSLRHRDQEAAEARMHEAERVLAEVQAHARRLEEFLATRVAEVERLAGEVDARNQELRELHARYAAAEEAHAAERTRLATDLDACIREVEGLHVALDAARQEATGLHAGLNAALIAADAFRSERDEQSSLRETYRLRLEAVLASRSWRWTAPLRRLVGEGPPAPGPGEGGA